MTDREPLRVGPLVLRWDPHMDAYSVRLGPGSQLRVYRMGDWCKFLVSTDSSCIDEIVGGHSRTHKQAAKRAAAFLTETGYLAQYRSRRRLLAREYERRAEEQRLLAGIGTWFEVGRNERHRARAVKYARWAEMLGRNDR